MPESIYAIAFLACPVGMALMMWLMMRGASGGEANDGDGDTKPELERLQSQIDDLRARQAISDDGPSSIEGMGSSRDERAR